MTMTAMIVSILVVLMVIIPLRIFSIVIISDS